MDWEKYLDTNKKGNGDPVTALYLPRGFVVSASFPLAWAALQWITRLTFDGHANHVLCQLLPRDTADVKYLRKVAGFLSQMNSENQARIGRAERDEPMPLIAGLRVHLFEDSLQVHAFRIAPFSSSVTVTIRPHLASRDGSDNAPPLTCIEWHTVGSVRDERLLLPEALGPLLRRSACAWSDPSALELETIAFRLGDTHMPLDMPKRWSLLDIEWPADKGGIVCFGGTRTVGYLVTLPHHLASTLVHHVASGNITLMMEHYYLKDLTRNPVRQKF